MTASIPAQASKATYLKRALSEAEAASYIGMSRSFLRQSRMDGDRDNRTPGPRWLRIGKRAIRYLREDLDGWLEQFIAGRAAGNGGAQ